MWHGLTAALLAWQLASAGNLQARDLAPEAVEAEITDIQPIKRNTSYYSISVAVDPDLGAYRDVQLLLRGAPVATHRLNSDHAYEFTVKGSANISWAVRVRSLRGKTIALHNMGKLPASLDGE